MPRTRENGTDRFRDERRKIQVSGIPDAIIEEDGKDIIEIRIVDPLR